MTEKPNNPEGVWFLNGYGKPILVDPNKVNIALERGFKQIAPPEEQNVVSNNTQASFIDRAKEFGQGIAKGVGHAADTVNRNVAVVPPLLLSKTSSGLANVVGAVSERAAEPIRNFSNKTAEIANEYANSNLGEGYANADFLKTNNTPDETSEVLKVGGEMIPEAAKWLGGTKALDTANKAYNTVKVLSKKGVSVVSPWLDKLNKALMSESGVAKTAATFSGGGMGSQILKNQNKHEEPKTEFEAVKYAVKDTVIDMAGFVLGGAVIEGSSQTLIKATKKAGKIITDSIDFIKNPSKESFSKIKPSIPDVIKSPIKTTVNKFYEKLLNTGDTTIDEVAIKALEKTNIKPSAMNIYKDNERVFQIANILPNKLYRTYADNLEKGTLEAIELDLDRELGILNYPKQKDNIFPDYSVTREEGVVRDAATKIDSVIEKPNLKETSQQHTSEIGDILDKNLAVLPKVEGSPIQSVSNKASAAVNNFVKKITDVKNSMYDNAIATLDSNDYVDLTHIHNEAKKLFKDYDIAASRGTSFGKVRDVSGDVAKESGLKLAETNNIEDIMGMLNGVINKNYTHPSYLVSLGRVLNQHISSGIVKKNEILDIIKLTKAIDYTFVQASKNKTIKNKNFPTLKRQADYYFSDTYKPMVELEATKAIISGKYPSYMYSQTATIDNRHKLLKTLEKIPNGTKLYNVLTRARAQDLLIDKISTNSILDPNKINKVFSNIGEEYELMDLLGEKTYKKLKEVAPNISKNISNIQELLKNPLIADNSPNTVMKLLNNREGLDKIKEQLVKLPKEEGDRAIKSIQRVAAKLNIENDIVNSDTLNNRALLTKLTDLNNEDYLIGILGKNGLERFKADILPLSKKIAQTEISDRRAGGYITGRGSSEMLDYLKRYGGEALTGLGGYQVGGLKGAAGLIVGKNILAYGFAKAATDPKLVNRLVELGRKGNEEQTFLFLMKILDKTIKSAKTAQGHFIINAPYEENIKNMKEKLPELPNKEAIRKQGEQMIEEMKHGY